MIGLGLDLSLRNYATGISYVKANRVLDLTTPFSELTFTLEDKSGEGNDATLYSGRYISTDGSTDRGIVADCSAAGAGNYYLTGKVRPNAVTTAELTMDGSTDSGLTGLAADVWQDFTTATSAVTPSAVQVGYDGSTASAADWSDVRLINATTGATVARWQLNESADGDLNGYPALDSVGGYHGTHTGCAGGTGEGIDADVVELGDYENEYWYDGVNDSLSLTSSISITNGADFTFDVKVMGVTASPYVFSGSDGSSLRISSAYAVRIRVSGVNYTFGSGLASDSFNTYRIVKSGGDVTVYRNGTSLGTQTIPDFIIDTVANAGASYTRGMISFTGSTDGTPSGSPVTVGQKRATILQTAGMDWNRKLMLKTEGDSVTGYLNESLPTDLQNLSDAITVRGSFISTDVRGTSALPALWGLGRTLVELRQNIAGAAHVPFSIGINGSKFALGVASNGTTNDEMVLGTTSLSNNIQYTFEVIIDGDNYTLSINDNVEASGTFVAAAGDRSVGATNSSLTAGIRSLDSGLLSTGASSTNSFLGVISNIEIFNDITATNKVYGFTMDGSGTVNGTPSNYLIPESDTTAGSDALGNAIAIPRPTADTWNLFGDGEYGVVADADSLDVTTQATWEIWGNFYGVPSVSQTLFSKYTDGANREWWIQKITINAADEVRFLAFGNGTSLVQAVSGLTDQVGHLVFTLDQTNGLKAYWNGVAMTVPAHAPIILDFATKTSPVVIGALATLSNFSDKKISRPKIYNRALSADEVLQNFNAQKSSFGL